MKYDVVSLSPDSEAGHQALHEYLQEGYEVAYECLESQGSGQTRNHIYLRRACPDEADS